MSEEKYMYGQGKLKLAEITPTGLGPWIWVGDVSELTGTLGEQLVSHRESHSGVKAKVREFGIEAEMSWSATMFQLDVTGVARFTQGKVSTTAQGTVTGEPFPEGLQPGDEVTLDHPGVSDLVIVDSEGTPVTLDPEHYEYDVYGNVKLLSFPDPAPTQPLVSAYAYAATKRVAFLAAARKLYALRYEGINLAENNQPVIMELYKVSPGLLQTLSMITNGNQLASAPVTFSSLADTSKPATGDLGRFGQIIEIDAA